MRAALAALAVAWVWGAVFAVPPNVLAAFDAYMDAVEANNLAGAVPHAEAAWQAASQGGVDSETLAVLAENRAEIYVLTGDHARAGAAWQDLAGVLERHNEEAEERARALVSAATQYALARDLPAAINAADAAIALYPQDAASNRLFLALRVKAVSEWARGQLGPAGAAADRALRVREHIGASVDSTTMTTAIIAAVGALMGRDEIEGAFYIALAEEIALAIPASRDDRVMLEGWSAYLRMQLSEQQRGELFQRTLNSALFGLELADGVDVSGQADELDGRDVVDARPERRDPPRYPVSMAQRGLEGFALVMFDVSAQGQPENVRTMLSIPHPQFGQTSAETVRRWRYTPRTVDGEPVRREGVVTHFIYSLR